MKGTVKELISSGLNGAKHVMSIEMLKRGTLLIAVKTSQRFQNCIFECMEATLGMFNAVQIAHAGNLTMQSVTGRGLVVDSEK